MSEPRPSIPGARARLESRRAARRRAEIIWLVVLSAFCALLVFGGVIASASLSEVFCASCHRSERTAQQRSAHEGIHCDSCHGGATLFDVADRRLGTVAMVAAAAAPGAQQLASRIPNEMCLECHADEMLKTVQANGIRMSHKEVIAAKWSCVRCHADSAHGVPDDGSAAYSMDTCLECHTVNPGNVQSCRQCHVAGAPRNTRAVSSQWDLVHGPQWRTTHGLGNLKTCKACHESAKCEGCHGLPIPHEATFPQTHGTVAQERGFSRCYTCHKPAACESCHGLTMPHPAAYLKAHAKDAQKLGEKRCLRCHEKASCDTCHAEHAHPGLDPDYLRQLKARPVGGP